MILLWVVLITAQQHDMSNIQRGRMAVYGQWRLFATDIRETGPAWCG
jgi:hypothetical protein